MCNLGRMYRGNLFVLIPLLAIFGYFLYKYAMTGAAYISADDAKVKLAKNEIDVILDVRTNMEYNLGHYPNAKHIPITQLQERVVSELPDRTSRILVYCNTGQRSRKASEILLPLGYKNVHYIAGPYTSLR
jgi:rhodanese-related sulfurtransferase